MPANDESLDEEEAPDSQIGIINVYNHHKEQEGWSSSHRTSPNKKMSPLGATKFAKVTTTQCLY